MKYASLRHSFLECILFRVVVNSAITRTYPHPLKPTHTQPKKGHTHPHLPTPSQKKATLTHNRPDQVTKRSHSLTPTQTQPKKGHTHPHPAKKCHSHAHQNILSQKRSLSPTHTHTQLKKMSHPPTSTHTQQKKGTLTHTHPHPAKKSHIHPCPARKGHTLPNITERKNVTCLTHDMYEQVSPFHNISSCLHF